MSVVGQIHNRWTVVSEVGHVNGHFMVNVQCSCGTLKTEKMAVIKFGAIKSCGCLKKETLAAKNRALATQIPVGSVFGRLTTISEPESLEGSRKVKCLCSCGITKTVGVSTLLSGSCKSCGCLKKDVVSARSKTHGLSGKTKLYSVWGSIKDRCSNPNCQSYHNYGGRGIRMSAEWFNDFETFYKDVGEPPFVGATLDRVDNDGDYCRENVRWATRQEQSSNTTRNKWYTYKGKETMLKDIAKAESMSLGTLYYRVNTMKLTIPEAIEKGIAQLTK